MANEKTTGKRKRNSTPLPEDPRERFKIIANRRGGNIVKGLDGLHVLANQYGDKKNKYFYTEEQALKLVEVLRWRLDALENALIAAVNSGGEDSSTKNIVLFE